MRITRKGQVTTRQEVRNLAGLHPGVEVKFFIGDDGVVRVVKADRPDPASRCWPLPESHMPQSRAIGC